MVKKENDMVTEMEEKMMMRWEWEQDKGGDEEESEVWGSHGGEYEDGCLLDCFAA
jgi:hypothetical protein